MNMLKKIITFTFCALILSVGCGSAPINVSNNIKYASVDDYSLVYDHVRPACVFLRTDIGLGTGFQIANGYILTAAHMVKDTSKMLVEFPDGVQQTTHTLVYVNTDQDLAVLKIWSNTEPVIKFSIEPLRIGSVALTIGNPLEKWMFSAGNISQVYDDNHAHFILFTAPISPGCSGGPLFNTHGEIIGVNIAYFRDTENINLASSITNLPSDYQHRPLITLPLPKK